MVATFESGRCTGCGKKVRDGDGNQEQRPDGDLDRFCWDCWRRRWADPER